MFASQSVGVRHFASSYEAPSFTSGESKTKACKWSLQSCSRLFRPNSSARAWTILTFPDCFKLESWVSWKLVRRQAWDVSLGTMCRFSHSLMVDRKNLLFHSAVTDWNSVFSSFLMWFLTKTIFAPDKFNIILKQYMSQVDKGHCQGQRF